jgi:hypothetical protein
VENCEKLWKTFARSSVLPALASAHLVHKPRLQDVERGVRLSACSGCAGDYEDPDATSGTEDFTGDLSNDEENEEPTAPEQFPAQRH